MKICAFATLPGANLKMHTDGQDIRVQYFVAGELKGEQWFVVWQSLPFRASILRAFTATRLRWGFAFMWPDLTFCD